MKRALDYALLLALLVAVAASFAGLGLDLSGLTEARSLTQMGRFAAGFFPPDFSAAHLAAIGRASLETLAMSALGTLLAVANALNGSVWGTMLAVGGTGSWTPVDGAVLANRVPQLGDQHEREECDEDQPDRHRDSVEPSAFRRAGGRGSARRSGYRYGGFP